MTDLKSLFIYFTTLSFSLRLRISCGRGSEGGVPVPSELPLLWGLLLLLSWLLLSLLEAGGTCFRSLFGSRRVFLFADSGV